MELRREVEEVVGEGEELHQVVEEEVVVEEYRQEEEVEEEQHPETNKDAS